jgi:hypothetical protein
MMALNDGPVEPGNDKSSTLPEASARSALDKTARVISPA